MRLTWSKPSRRHWRNSAAASLALLILEGAQAPGEETPVAAIGDQPIEVSGAEGSGTLLAFSSRPLLARMPGITRLLVMIHGAGRDGDQALAGTLAAIGAAADRTLVVAPQFLSEADFRRWTLSGDRLRWPDPGWEAGDAALGPSPLSPFTALDSLLHGLADPALLPGLKAITLAGRAEGADLVQLYAASTTRLSSLEARGIAIRFVLAQPIHYLYLDQARPIATDVAACPGFDQWPYGLDAAPSYLDRLGPARILAQYRARDVVYLLSGSGGPDEPDTPCAITAQGPDRLARGRFYLGYLALLAGVPVHRLAEIGADGPALLASGCGVAALLDRPDCPALAAAPAPTPFPTSAPPAEPAAPEPARSVPNPAPAMPEAPPPPSVAQTPLPDRVAPGGSADPLQDANPLTPLLTRAPVPPKPSTPPR
jgi:hypothetical protein